MTTTKEGAEPKQKRKYTKRTKATVGTGGDESGSAVAGDPRATKSLLAGLVPATAVAAHVVMLDFSGQEDLLTRAQAATDDLPRDIMALLAALLDGKLFTNNGSILARGEQ